MSLVTDVLKQQLVDLGRCLPREWESVSLLSTKRGQQFISRVLEAALGTLSWEFGEEIRVENLGVELDASSFSIDNDQVIRAFRGGARIELQVSSHVCRLLVPQDLAARLIHQALLGVPLPRFTAELKAAALGFSIAELMVRYAPLQRVPVLMRTVELLSSETKMAQCRLPFPGENALVLIKCGLSIGACSYALSLCLSEPLLRWATPFIRETPYQEIH